MHADETFAMAVFSILDGDNLVIYRTRNEDEIALCKRAIDVGRVYDPDNDRFDHHQSGFFKVHHTGIHFASAGLVWEKYGVTVVQKLYPHILFNDAHDIAEKICEKLVMCLDGLDTVSIQFSKTPRGLTTPPMLIETVLNRITEQFEGDERFAAMVLAFRRLLILVIEGLVEKNCPTDLNLQVCDFLSGYDEEESASEPSPGAIISRDSGVPVASAGRIWRRVAKKFLETEFPESVAIAPFEVSELVRAIDKEIIMTFDGIETGLLLPHTGSAREGEGEPIDILSSHEHLNLFLQRNDTDGFNATLRDWIIGKLLKIQRQSQISLLIEGAYLATEDRQILIFREIWPDRNKLIGILRKKYPDVLVVVYGVTGEGWRAIIPNQQLLLFPEEWIGDNPPVIIDGVRITDVTFVHTARFFAAVKTQEAAELVARELVKRFLVQNSASQENSTYQE